MRKIYLLSFLLISTLSLAQNFGDFASGLKINNTIYNVTAAAPIHQIDPSSSAPFFNGANLGSFGQNSSCANITGAEIKTWKNASGNVCSGSLKWRVYSSTPSGTFSSFTLTSVSDCNLSNNIFMDGLGPCGGNDQKWKNYSNSSNFTSGLTPGNYTLEIYFDYTGSDVSSSTCETTKYINNSGTNYKATFTISNPTTSPTVSATNLCEGDLLTLTANPANGVAPYTYSWTGPNGYTSSAQNPTITTTLLSAGIYSLVVTDACGAVSNIQSTANVDITAKTTPSFDAILPAICNGGTAPLLPNLSTNGISGTWNPAIVNNTTTGTYVFTPDPGQCASIFTQTIFVINNVTPTFSTPLTLCQGASAPNLHTVSNNGIQGTWSPSTVDNTTTGTYVFTPNAGQCALQKTITITVIPNITPVFTLPTFICQGATAPLLPTTSNNGVIGTWNPATVSNTTSGNYIFTHSAGQCASNTLISISVNPNVTPTFTAIAPICANATAPVLASTSNNGIAGTWNPATVDNTTSGTYTFTPNAGLCAVTTTINVTVNPNITPTFDPIADVCFQSTAPSLPSSSLEGITGTWNPATVSNTTAGTYTFTPTPGQCALPATINIGITIVTPTFDPIAPFCAGATAPVLATTSTNGITGTWNPATINNTTTATYTFTPAAGQCAITTTLDVTVTPMTTTTFDPIAPICANATAPILATTSNNGVTGSWNPATINNTTSGTYTFTPDAGLCATVYTLNMVVTPNVTPTFTITTSICQNATAPILATTSNNGILGSWNPAVVDNTTSGTYTFTPNTGLCAFTTSVDITVNPNVTPTFNPIAPICAGATAPILPLTSTNGITGTWNPAVVSNTTSATYTFTPTAGLCATTTTLDVTVTPMTTTTFDPIAPICTNATAPILPTTSNNGVTGTWNPATVSNTASGSYTFTPTAGQCATPVTVSITVTPNVTPSFTVVTNLCANATAPILATTSNNGITGTWNPATVDNTTSGIYTFTPTTGVCAITINLNIVVNPNVLPTFNPIAPFCANTTAPSLPTTSTNGITGTWNPATVSNTTSATYTFTPTAGLCALPTTLDITVSPNILPTFTPIAPVCFNGTAPILPTTSNNGITGTWNPATVSTIAAGTYTFTPSANQCATSATVNITINAITPTFDPIAPICYGTTAPVLPTTSNNGINGTWNPSTISNTASGTYTFTPAAGQCSLTPSINVIVNTVAPTFNTIPNVCYGATAPTLPTTSTNGITGTWNPAIVSNTVAGTYTFTPDANQCATTATMNIGINIVTTNFNPIAPICANATAPVLLTTSTNGITGTWNPATVDNTTTGTYNFTPDANQCATTATMTVTVNPNITPTFNTIPDVCYGATAPTLPSTSTNGISGTWNPATISNTTAGTYFFTPAANVCATTTSLSIGINIITPSFNPIADVCYGATAPSLPTTSTNGITGTWSPATISNTTAGTYNFTPDANQCATTASLSIGINIINPTFNAIPDVCYGATAPTLPTTSTNGITGSWNPATVSNTTAGTYTFTPDANQCATTATMNIGINIVTTNFNAIAPICANATAPILPLSSTNGITGTWNPAVVSNTTTGTYNFTPDANQCATTATLTVTVIPNATPTFNQIPDVCYGATAPTFPTTSTNGITGTWNPATISNTIAGTYTFTPDAGQCALTTTMNIGINVVNPNFTPIAAICANATAPVLVTTSLNGITGTWNPATVDNTTSATYTFNPDANQCATSTTLSITVNPNLTPSFTQIPDVCFNGIAPTFATTSNNGITGTWNPATISNTTAGTYTFTPDANQCAVTTTMNIGINTITPTFIQIPDVCLNSTAPSLPTTSTNGITGTWNPATVSNTTAATYTFTPDANQCAITITMNIGINSITPSFTQIPDVCYGGTAPSLPTTSNNGITGTWNPASVSNTTAGMYTFTPNPNQCATTTTMTIGINSVTPNFAAIAPICQNATAPVLLGTSNNGISGNWNPAVVSNTASNTYTFTPNAGQCATTTSLSVTVIPNTTPTFNFATTICQNATAPTLPATSVNGVTGTWNPTVIDTTTSGSYLFTPDAGQCALSVSVAVTIVINVTPTFSAIAPICSSSTSPILPLTSINGYTGTWNPAVVSNMNSGTYTFTANAGQCATQASLSVTVYQSPTDIQATVTNVLNNVPSGGIKLTNVVSGVAPFQYSINNSAFTTTTDYNQLAPGDYTIIVKDANGCEYTKTFTVESACIFPKGISPNGDTLNDTFNLNGCNVVKIDFYNRYGTRVNGYSNYASQWDGKDYDSKELPDGTYFYQAEMADGTTTTGWVYIAR
ncbi:gliding motility-associated C-terminal domain-containing protein [Flavobacterium sp. SUN046]|uniref:T9SS type B sorting domain-containing protein n=1 Tax=Flavobacterium sp. SUN046 TaxID=3002440 RepID=UPI002DBB834C|nr:gliding motility-associated C-terminal domain-containing protein [Flavobacterium sp. SUN046]MEC4049148.1 gliding motility-associated C-terminal domain-containing protein [Flavobacterium sp. SUN046]